MNDAHTPFTALCVMHDSMLPNRLGKLQNVDEMDNFSLTISKVDADSIGSTCSQ